MKNVSRNNCEIMKIAYILPIGWGGVPHYTAGLASAISKHAEVVVLKPKDANDELFSEDVKVIHAFKHIHFSRNRIAENLSPKNFASLLSFKFIKIIDKIKPDVVHFPELYPQTCVPAFLFRIHKKYSIVSTLHAVFDVPLHLHLLRNLLRRTNLLWSAIEVATELTKRLVQSDIIVVHTEKQKQILVSRGMNPTKVVVIPHGVLSCFNREKIENKDKANDNYVLFFGRIVETKGIEYLINAIPIVSREIPDVKIIIAGEGAIPLHLRSVILREADRFEIYNKYIPNEMVPKLFRRSKVVVLPYTRFLGHSGVLTIAFSFGKPVIVTRVGDFPKLVSDRKEGLIVPPRDVEALANAIIKLLKDDELRKQMERNSLKKANELSWENIANMYMEVYKKALSFRRRRT